MNHEVDVTFLYQSWLRLRLAGNDLTTLPESFGELQELKAKFWKINSLTICDEGTQPILSKSSLKDGVMSWNQFDHIFLYIMVFQFSNPWPQSLPNGAWYLSILEGTLLEFQSIGIIASEYVATWVLRGEGGHDWQKCMVLLVPCFWNDLRNKDSFSLSRWTSCVEVMLHVAQSMSGSNQLNHNCQELHLQTTKLTELPDCVVQLKDNTGWTLVGE